MTHPDARSEAPLRILQVMAGQDGGGILPYVRSLGRLLRERGHEVHTVVLRRGDLFDTLVEAGLEPVLIPRGFRFDPRTVLGIARYVKRHRIQVVHTHSVPANLYGRPGARLGGAKLVTSVHANTVHELASALGAGRGARFAQWLDLNMASMSHVLAPVSGNLRESLIERGIAAERIEVVHNAVEDRPVDADAPLPEGLPRNGRPLVVTAGRLTPIKNLGVFVQAAALLAEDGVDVDCVILGEGPERAGLERQVSELGIADRVHFTGWRNDLEQIYPHSLALVMTSTMEGFPTVVLEAMRASRPAVCSRVGGIPEIIVDGETGFLCPPNDPRAFADALARLAREPELVERLGQNGHRRFRREFTFERIAEQFESLYRRLL